jgi:cholesterol transport system auxiliary component
MMGSMRAVRIAAIPLLAMLAGACLGGGSTPSELLTLTPTNVLPAGATRSAGAGEAVAVNAPSVPRSLSANRIPVYVSPTTVQYLVNATWVEEPRELFRHLLSETIAARTGRLVLHPDNFSQGSGVTLSGQLLQLGLEPGAMEVVVVYEAALSRGGQSLQQQRFEARVPVAEQTAAVVVPALNQAANQVAEQVADWIGR